MRRFTDEKAARGGGRATRCFKRIKKKTIYSYNDISIYDEQDGGALLLTSATRQKGRAEIPLAEGVYVCPLSLLKQTKKKIGAGAAL